MLHRFIVAFSAIALFAGLSAGLAKADTCDMSNMTSPTVVTAGSEYDFTYVVGSDTYMWSLPEPVAATNVALGQSFNIEGISYTLNGGSATIGDLEFYSSALKGGFALASYPPVANQTYFVNATGPVLYQGSEASPNFGEGTETFSNLIDGAAGGASGTLTISEVSATATPEASTLLLTGIGLVAVFWVARKRRLAEPL